VSIYRNKLFIYFAFVLAYFSKGLRIVTVSFGCFLRSFFFLENQNQTEVTKDVKNQAIAGFHMTSPKFELQNY